MNDIKFYEEKLWIMASFFRKRRKRPIEDIYNLWCKWWPTDFASIEEFRDTYCWIMQQMSLSRPELKQKRREAANLNPVSGKLQRRAGRLGFMIKKSSLRYHPTSVSGFQICYLKNPNHVIAGQRFDLSFPEVKEFLREQEEKNASMQINGSTKASTS